MLKLSFTKLAHEETLSSVASELKKRFVMVEDPEVCVIEGDTCLLFSGLENPHRDWRASPKLASRMIACVEEQGDQILLTIEDSHELAYTLFHAPQRMLQSERCRHN